MGGGDGGTGPIFLTTALDGCEWSSSRLYRFTHQETASDTHWVGPRAGLDAVEEREIFCPYREPNSDFSAVQPTAQSLYRPSSWLRDLTLGTRLCTQADVLYSPRLCLYLLRIRTYGLFKNALNICT
jgi:hypothetical protein